MECSTQIPVTNACCPQPAISPSLATASQTQMAAISVSKSMDLDLVTEEGDKVTLSLDAQAAAVYARNSSLSMGDDGDYLYRQTELATGRYQVDFSLSIEGDLNADERREIRKVVKTLNKMMGQLASGDVQPDIAAAHKLSGLETIASLDAHLSYERQVLVAQQSQTAVVYDSSGEIAEKPAEASTPRFHSRFPKPEAADAMAKKMARHFNRAKAPWGHKMKAVQQLFETHRKLAAARAENAQAPNIFDYLREKFDQAVKGEISVD